MAKLISPQGEIKDIQVPKAGQLAFLQGLVHGYIEIVGVVQDSAANKAGFEALLCNEEGKIMAPPMSPNLMATKFAGMTSDLLVGPILFIKNSEVD